MLKFELLIEILTRLVYRADESFQMKKKQKDNTGIPRNPPNLMTGVFSMVDKPATVVKSAKELEGELC